MKLRPLLACAFAVPMMTVTAGCDGNTVATILEDEDVQRVLVQVTVEAGKYVFKQVAETVVDALSTPAVAATVDAPNAMPTVDQPADSAQGKRAVASQRLALATTKALAVSDQEITRSDSGKLSFKCDKGEQADACKQRLQVDLVNTANARVVALAEAFGTCIDIAKGSNQNIGVVESTSQINDCVAGRGFQSEVAQLVSNFSGGARS